jgi:hypothetical protein
MCYSDTNYWKYNAVMSLYLDGHTMESNSNQNVLLLTILKVFVNIIIILEERSYFLSADNFYVKSVGHIVKDLHCYQLGCNTLHTFVFSAALFTISPAVSCMEVGLNTSTIAL